MPIRFLVQVAGDQVNVGLLTYFMPLFMFMFAFALMYAFLTKTKILGDAVFTNALVSFVIAIIFVTTPLAVQFTGILIPWMVVFFVSALFIFLIYVWLGNKDGGLGLIEATQSTAIAWGVVVVLIIIFLYAGIQTFGPILAPFAPGMPVPTENLTPSEVIGFQIRSVLFNPAVLGVSLLFIIAALTAWVLGQKS
ncbi:MAG: hypothetical protein AABX59_03035 [Nanoarchaeota archaeon]